MEEQEDDEPTINHVAVTVPRDLLDADGRRRIADFFGSCFGLKEDAQWSKDRQLMVLRSGPPDRPQHDAKGLYMAIIGHDKPSTANPGLMGDHFGITCKSLHQFNTCLTRVRDFAAKDKSIELINEETTRAEGGTLHMFYFRFVTPFAVEVQYFDKSDVSSETSRPLDMFEATKRK